MTHPFFLKLLPSEQVRLALAQGSFLARRQQQNRWFHLYHLPNAGLGIFVELCFEPKIGTIVVMRSATDITWLDEYVAHICLPASA